MLHHREKLHVRETQAAYVFSQLGGQLPVGERTVVFLRHPHPGTNVDLVDGQWAVESVPTVSLLHPGSIAPGIVQVPDNGGGAGWLFEIESEGAGLIYPVGSIARR
jgi:hypothetical protein